jgi:hypothetical protein
MSDLDQLERLRDEVREPDVDAVDLAARAGVWNATHGSRRRRIASRTMVGVAAAAVAVAVVSTVLPIGRGGPDPAAADMLRRFARIAEHAPAEAAPDAGEYVYRRTRSTTSYLLVAGDGEQFLFTQGDTMRFWLGTDGSGRQISSSEPAVFASDAERSAFESYVATPQGKADGFASLLTGETSDDRYGPGELTYRDTSALPTDIDQLRQLIEDRQIVDGPDGDWESFVLATDLIRDSYARPELRAALYRVMATLDGIEVVGDTTDATGRHGIALASTHAGYTYEVVFDPKTAEILEERTVILNDDDWNRVHENPGPTEVAAAPPGQPLYVTTYLTLGAVVDSVTELPNS